MSRKKIKIQDIKGGLLPDAEKMLDNEVKDMNTYWGKTWAEAVAAPKTHEDLIFGALMDIRETALRIEDLIIKQKQTITYPLVSEMFGTNDDAIRHYLKNFFENGKRLTQYLEEGGYVEKIEKEKE